MISVERNLNSMGEDPLTQATHGPDMNPDMGDDLQYEEPTVAGRLEPNMPSREGVSGMNTSHGPRLNIVCQFLSEAGRNGLQNVLLDDTRNSSLENRAPLVDVPLGGAQESVTATPSVPRTTSMEEIQPNPKTPKTRNKRKRENNFLDGRTELTSDELKEIRETYLQRQDVLRSEMEVKRREREATLLFDRLLWAVPHDSELFYTTGDSRSLDVIPALQVTAPEIVDLWRENLRTQFNARLGIQTVAEKSLSLVHCAFSMLISPYSSWVPEKTPSDQTLATPSRPGDFAPCRRRRSTNGRGHR